MFPRPLICRSLPGGGESGNSADSSFTRLSQGDMILQSHIHIPGGRTTSHRPPSQLEARWRRVRAHCWTRSRKLVLLRTRVSALSGAGATASRTTPIRAASGSCALAAELPGIEQCPCCPGGTRKSEGMADPKITIQRQHATQKRTHLPQPVVIRRGNAFVSEPREMSLDGRCISDAALSRFTAVCVEEVCREDGKHSLHLELRGQGEGPGIALGNGA